MSRQLSTTDCRVSLLEKIKEIKKIIEKEVFVSSVIQSSVLTEGSEARWIFDFRRIIMQPEVLDILSDIFWEKFQTNSTLQIGCLETAGIPLVTAYALKVKKNNFDVNAFFIRKSRKKHGLLNMVEGKVGEGKIILVDDIINSGKSFIRQVEVIESLGKKVDTVYSILRYRDDSYYTYFHEKGIKVESLFSLDDFTESLGVQNLVIKHEQPVPMPFEIKWSFRSEKANYFYVVPKSAPALDADKLYFGSDSGIFWALNQSDGSVAWKYKVYLHSKGKYIFSSPVVHNNLVYFGSYDGNMYALDTETGKVRWIFMEADWIGSSPCVAPKLNILYVGLEFGLFKKQGSVVALSLDTGKKIWEYTVPNQIHASPIFVEKYNMVACGSNNFSVYALNAKNGKLLWEFKANGEIKESLAYDPVTNSLVFGSFDGTIYILDVKTGGLRYAIKTDASIYSTPLIYNSTIYATSLDKNIYSIDAKTGIILWKFQTEGRIFSSPEVINGKIYFGSNDGRLYELDAHTGKNTAFFQTTERITNKIAYNSTSKNMFVPTFANEIYCLEKK